MLYSISIIDYSEKLWHILAYHIIQTQAMCIRLVFTASIFERFIARSKKIQLTMVFSCVFIFKLNKYFVHSAITDNNYMDFIKNNVNKKTSIIILIYEIDLKFGKKVSFFEKNTTTNFVNEETFISARFLQTKCPKIRTTLLGDSWSIYYTLNISILS